MKPQLIATLRLYTREEGGFRLPLSNGFRCPCFTRKDTRDNGWTCFPLIGETPLAPGESRRLGFVFLRPEAVEEIKTAGIFYLWNGASFTGEATNVSLPEEP